MSSTFRLLSVSLLALVLVSTVCGETPARKDAFGDPVPDSVLMRLGTARFRVGPMQTGAQLSPDGKLIAT